MQRDEENLTQNKIKSFLRNVRLVIVVLVVVTLALLVFFNIDEINTDNFRRILAKIDFSFNQVNTNNSGTISFNGDSLNCYDIYKGGLAVLSTDGLKIYDEKGNEFNSIQSIYHTPTMQTTKKFILTYDRGGTSLNIANSFTNVFSKTFPNRILNASMAENGSFLVITEYEGYKALITVFDSSFNEKFLLYNAQNYILDAELSNDGQVLTTATLKSAKGEIEATINSYKVGKDIPFYSFSIADCIPFELKYKSNGNLCVISDKKVVFISKDGKKEGEINFEGRLLYNFSDNNNKFFAFITGTGLVSRNSHIIIADDKGNIWTNGDIEGAVKYSTFTENGLALLEENNILLIDFSNKTNIKIKKNIIVKGEFEELLSIGTNGYAVASNYAEIVNLNN